LSVNTNLTGNPLTSVPPNSGVIKLVSSVDNGTCDPTGIETANIEPDLRAWSTHLDQTTPGTLFTTETGFVPAPLSWEESSFLPYTCRFVQYLGSGKGVCTQ
jgi:hypothetical protein